MPNGPAAPNSTPVVFTISSPPKQISFYGKWVANVPVDATMNDVCKMMHAKLWELAEEPNVADWWYCDDRTLLSTKVVLTEDPWRPTTTLPLYVCQARYFHQYIGSLEKEDGLPHVRAIAFD